MTKQAQRKALAREASKLVESNAPAIVDEQILAHALDEIAEFTGDLMGKLTNVDAEDEKAIVMAHGIIRDGLISEVIKQLRTNMHDDLDKRLKKFSTLPEKK